jgi:hypothetical protein
MNLGFGREGWRQEIEFQEFIRNKRMNPLIAVIEPDVRS